MADGAPGPIVGTGRAATVFDIGRGRVLRRYRPGTAARAEDVVREAVVMRHLHEHGYPVPEVFDVDGRDLVMERLDGVTMLTDLERRPWQLGRHARAWAELHRHLAAVPVGDLAGRGLSSRFGPPEAIVHLDFHPDNIMLTPAGPVVFDWTNVALGPAAADVALAWVIGMTSTVDGSLLTRAVVSVFRRRLIDRFVDAAGRDAAAALVPTVGAHRLVDSNVRPEEARRIRQMIAAHS